ncbi:MAG: transglutaminase domain-containing protein [Bacteroidaceae bacterium]|nr:transglutaminase domain-containing protein [Bacteroidaceae bacterium]
MQNKNRKTIQGALIVGLFAFVGGLFSACTSGDEAEVQDALDFLYAGMPLPDSVDYPREFWEANARMAVKARHEMPWGEKVPGREWRHFVLPLRVNNEDLDSFRIAYYDELKARVEGKTMYQAVLEVNHWCHEHVSYQPSDSRTSSPMNTLRSAIGRCGEESTFTVTALRTIGIPARQVYTPRWAHTDDNHAWVEAWVDGTWYFLGACEPEPLLNLGWFNESASRGMLMHTKAFGDYTGPEEVVNKTACYTEINVTKNYCDVSTIIVTVLSQDSLPVSGASVDYRLYNYAELYPIVSKQSDAKGQSSLTCGKGDLIVWASKDGMFGFQKVSVGKEALVTVVMDKDSTYTASLDLDLIPPLGRDNKPDVSADAARANRRRLAEEDSIRIAYMDEAFCRDAAPDSPEALARANWRTIVAFRKQTDKQLADEILATLSRKDYRDVTLDVLMDVSQNLSPLGEMEGSRKYVLSPRVANERLTPCRKTLSEYFRGMTAEQLQQWVRDSITVDDTRNPQHLCMSPLGVLRHRTCDAHSRDIFLVSAARAIGIPARIDEVTGKVETLSNSPLKGEDSKQEVSPLRGDLEGSLRLNYTDQAVKENPSYYSHFALSRIEKGRPQLLEFPENATWRETFADGVDVEAGQYMLLSGTRLANGGVLAKLNIFHVAAEQQHTEQLRLRADEDKLRVIANFDCEQYFTNARGVHKKILETTGRGFYMIALIRSGHEPSTHLLHDMEAANIHISQWSGCYLMLFESQEDYAKFDRREFDDLPSNVLFGVADPETFEAMHIEELTHGNKELPIVMLCDTFNRVVWFRQGYNIGLADQLMDALRKVILKE